MRTVGAYERELVAAYMTAQRDRDEAAMPVCPTCGDGLELGVTVGGYVRRVIHPWPACPEFVEYMENLED